MKLSELNALCDKQAYQEFEHCCVAPNWVEGMIKARPFISVNAVYSTAELLWSILKEDDYLAAFQGHPEIGDVSTLRAKFAATASKASHEQSGMSQASDTVLHQMMALNQAYKEKFGFIFIVCATGKSAEQMLAMIEQRIENDRDTELAIAANEQAKITRIRLENLL
ncbi:2-oxo-4-hydroxy-4-carboxy-5-ureidoimidazoline decarboxylase [Colwellia echini]|uniref:2-oxo-4-hydroxy-4-carboxy-5-ureidoimidazoline decarboxylase n=1 Tax=Colwellia echini TaxID=1982103 RepID=A0ABY3MZI5_9GAMM|nr:2-oxo-4-hydroxy-4-carboxy-5-ureidoimidazoline decarboxylase [Colwellia echini]TYK66646.1 2-oxo-4-hydroxy-4-carboxy-5-ureidoimidazoline decarboxylase [Colwellia echini]